MDAHSQSDVLYSLLEQIQEDDDSDSCPSPIAAVVPSSPVAATVSSPAAVVGPTATELESLNELIKFDHIYYKPAVPTVPSVSLDLTVDSDCEIVEVKQEPVQAPACSAATTGPAVTITPAKQEPMAVTATPATQDVVAVPMPPAGPELAVEAELDLDELLDLGGINWNQFNLDLDSLSPTDSSDTAQLPVTPLGGCSTTTTGHTNVLVDTSFSRKRKLSSDTVASLPSSPTTSSVCSFDLTDNLFGLEQPTLSLCSQSESGYSSELSDMGSPKSDISSTLEDSLWGDSFTELFPSLM